jgi:hypothetical protein
MKQRFLLLVLLALSGVSCDPDNPIGNGADRGYLPLATGNLWEYEVVAANSGGTTPAGNVTVQLGNPFTYDGVTWYGANDYCVERTISSPLPMFCAAWGVRGRRVLFMKQGPGPAIFDPETVLDLPVWVGKSWFTKEPIDTSYVTAGGDTVVRRDIRRRTVRGVSAVIVPAGTFERCILVADTSVVFSRVASADGAESVTFSKLLTSEWYAQDLGLVKQVVERFTSDETTPGVTETRRLIRYIVAQGK